MFNDNPLNEMRSDKEEENVVFRYSRENRLKNAPESVRSVYNGNFQVQKGFKVLFKNKTNRFLLIALVLMTAFAMIYSKAYGAGYKGTVGDCRAELTAFSFEEKVYMTVKLTEKNGKPASEKELVFADIVIRAYDVNNQLAYEEKVDPVLLEKSENKIQRTITDFDIASCQSEITVKEEKIVLFTDIKR